MAYRRTDRYYAGNHAVKNGRIVLKRDSPGLYYHQCGNHYGKHAFKQFHIFRLGERSEAPGAWAWAEHGKLHNLAYNTKAGAAHALQRYLYGERSFEPDYNL